MKLTSMICAGVCGLCCIAFCAVLVVCAVVITDLMVDDEVPPAERAFSAPD